MKKNKLIIKKEHKYCVIKLDDIKKYLTLSQKLILKEILQYLEEARFNEGKKNNDYIICNQDEPYSNDVWDIIIKGEINKD